MKKERKARKSIMVVRMKRKKGMREGMLVGKRGFG